MWHTYTLVGGRERKPDGRRMQTCSVRPVLRDYGTVNVNDADISILINLKMSCMG